MTRRSPLRQAFASTMGRKSGSLNTAHKVHDDAADDDEQEEEQDGAGDDEVEEPDLKQLVRTHSLSLSIYI